MILELGVSLGSTLMLMWVVVALCVQATVTARSLASARASGGVGAVSFDLPWWADLPGLPAVVSRGAEAALRGTAFVAQHPDEALRLAVTWSFGATSRGVRATERAYLEYSGFLWSVVEGRWHGASLLACLSYTQSLEVRRILLALLSASGASVMEPPSRVREQDSGRASGARRPVREPGGNAPSGVLEGGAERAAESAAPGSRHSDTNRVVPSRSDAAGSLALALPPVLAIRKERLLCVGVLGSFWLHLRGHDGLVDVPPASQELGALLAACLDSSAPRREELIKAMELETSKDPQVSLRQRLSRLRQAVTEAVLKARIRPTRRSASKYARELIKNENGHFRLARDEWVIDYEIVLRLHADARRDMVEGRPDDALARWSAVAQLIQGEPFAGLRFIEERSIRVREQMSKRLIRILEMALLEARARRRSDSEFLAALERLGAPVPK